MTENIIVVLYPKMRKLVVEFVEEQLFRPESDVPHLLREARRVSRAKLVVQH
jgi:hypothetical protein